MRACDPGEAWSRAPRKAPTAGQYWARDRDGRAAVPTAEWASSADPELVSRASKLDQCPLWWDLDWPVVGVSWDDMIHYAEWARVRTGFPLALVHDMLWEKAARGPDGRFFPWGNALEFSFCNTSASHEDGKRPCRVEDFPSDESPYGVRGMAGNNRDLCLNTAGEAYARWRTCRGGVWVNAGFMIRSASRTGLGPEQVDLASGGRLAFYPRLPVPPIARKKA